MNKEEILAKSRAENKNKDVYEIEVLKQANSCGIIVMAVLAVIFFPYRSLWAAVKIGGCGHLFSVQAWPHSG